MSPPCCTRSLTDWVGLDRPVQLLCSRRQARALKATARRLRARVRMVSKNLGSEIRQEARSLDVVGENSLRRMSTDQEVPRGRRRKRVKKRQDGDMVLQHKNYIGSQLMYQWLEQMASR